MLSVVSYPERGNGGRNDYRGNCSPKMIEDIINQYQLRSLNDYMVGSGTTEDVCKAMGIEHKCYDLNRGFDMMTMDIPERPENIFWHPPYDDIIVYSDKMYKANDIIQQYGFDPRINDLSRCKGWEDFVRKMNYCMNKQFASLEKYDNMGKEVDKVYQLLKQYEREIYQANDHLKKQYEANVQFFQQLEKYVVAGEIGIEEIEAFKKRIEENSSQSPDEKQMVLQNLDMAKEMLAQRVFDLQIAENVAMQTCPMIQTMQMSNYNLLRKINSSFIITLPMEDMQR